MPISLFQNAVTTNMQIRRKARFPHLYDGLNNPMISEFTDGSFVNLMLFKVNSPEKREKPNDILVSYQ